MSIPALQALRAQYPRSYIAILARTWVAGLYGREPFCDELIPYEAPKGWRGFGEKWAMASELRRRDFDCAILFQNAFEAAAMARLASIPVRVGYSRESRGWLLTSPIPVPKKGEIPRHHRFYYLELLKRARLISSYVTDLPIRLSGAESAAEAGRRRFWNASLAQPVIGLSPGAAYGGAKRWHSDRFAESTVELARKLDACAAVFGSKQELDICESVHRKIVGCGCRSVNFAGETTIAEFVELAAACELFLTNDSGPMHIASALGVPTIAIFGATDEVATGPTGDVSRVVREPVECSPCLLRECPIDHRCMTRVSATRVAREALELVDVKKTQGG